MATRDEPDSHVSARAERLVGRLRTYGRTAVALSGGVDSTVVAAAAVRALGDDAVAITGVSASLPASELDTIQALARRIGIRHHALATHEFEDANYVRNDGARCYHCKSELYDRMIAWGVQQGFAVICSGANVDDLGDYRPGLSAAAERGVRHPLQEAGFTKAMVRELARYWDLPNADKPASPCLSSRIAVGLEATPERTSRVDRAEQVLRQLGLGELRVRYHPGDLARIEVPLDDLPRLVEADVRSRIVEQFRALGFAFVALDLAGFRSGSLNVLVPPEMLRASARRVQGTPLADSEGGTSGTP